MAKLQPARGTHDLMPADMRRHRAVGDAARRVAGLYGFDEIATPIFEFSDVFRRTLGDTSDIVTKEMYSFVDKRGEEITLRPENTPGVVRAVLSNGLLQQAPLKFFYFGPMFRYERPQKGRQRQFHQIDLEVLGAPEPGADIEVISVAADILDRLGILDRCVLKLNSLGDPESRAGYRKVLVDYYSAHLDRLSEDSRNRLQRNPLRILDSKDEGDKAINAGAPSFADYLNEASRDFFAAVNRALDDLGVPHELDDRLVRGLDYYTHTTFEFVSDALDAAQSTIGGGGRYDGLVTALGGPDTPGIGFGTGIERVLLACDAEEVFTVDQPLVDVYVVDTTGGTAARDLVTEFRRAGIAADRAFDGRSMKSQMKSADRSGASVVCIIGDDELAAGTVTVRELRGDQTQTTLDRAGLVGSISERLVRQDVK